MILPKQYPCPDILESNCRRITVRGWHSRYSPHGDFNQANIRRGVFRAKILTILRALAPRSVAPRF